MMLYPKPTSLSGPTDQPVGQGAGLPAGITPSKGAPVTVPEAQTLIADNAVSEILPVGGLKILNADEPLAKQVTKGAQDALAKTVTQVCLDGIRAMAIVKYVMGFAPMMAADRGKRSKDLLALTARLRAWSVICKINLLALNERYNKALVDEMTALLGTLKALGLDGPVTQGLLTDIDALKLWEGRLFAAQQSQECGGSFKLYEYHVLGENTTFIAWYGPMSVRTRVAMLKDNPDTSSVEAIKGLFDKVKPLEDVLPLDKVPVFPIPDIVSGRIYNGQINPQFESAVVGLADYEPYSKYESDGADKSVTSASLSKWAESYKSLWIEQATRQIDGYSTHEDPAIKAAVQQMLTAMNVKDSASYGKAIVDEWSTGSFTFGDLVYLGLTLDPEWGGGAVDHSKTPEEVMKAALPLIRKYQDTYRNKVALKTDDGSKKLKPVGPYAKALVKEGAIKSATTDAAIVPPLPVMWEPSGDLLAPTLIKDTAWKKYVLNPDTEVNQSMTDWVKQWNADLWGGGGPVLGQLLDDMADCLVTGSTGKLAQWKPDANGKLPDALPYPLVYKYDAIAPKLPQYLTLSMGKYAEVSGKQVSAEQQDLIDVRSDYKSTVLLAMRSAEFAGSVLDSTKALVQAIKNLTKILYGDCPIEEAPDTTAKEDLYAFYLKQTEACAANPKEGSLLDTLNKANELYKSLLAKEAAKDASASQTLQVVAQQIAKTQERVNVLVAELKGKLAQVKGNIEDEGGLFYFIDSTITLLGTLDKLPTTVVIGGVTYTAEPSQEEKDAIKDTKDKIKKIQIDGLKIIGFAGAQSQTLIKVGDEYSIDFGTSVGGGLKDINDWAVATLGQKKPFPWWLLLLTAAAAARESK